MKELFGTTLIVILAFLAGFLAFWFRKFLLAGVALALLLSGCDSGSRTIRTVRAIPEIRLTRTHPASPGAVESHDVWPHPFPVIKVSVRVTNVVHVPPLGVNLPRSCNR